MCYLYVGYKFPNPLCKSIQMRCDVCVKSDGAAACMLMCVCIYIFALLAKINTIDPVPQKKTHTHHEAAQCRRPHKRVIHSNTLVDDKFEAFNQKPHTNTQHWKTPHAEPIWCFRQTFVLLKVRFESMYIPFTRCVSVCVYGIYCRPNLVDEGSKAKVF